MVWSSEGEVGGPWLRFVAVDGTRGGFSPLSSCTIDTTQALSDDPSTVNKAAESDGWFAKFKVRACIHTNVYRFTIC